MTAIMITIIICSAALVGLHMNHLHERNMRADGGLVQDLLTRVCNLESKSKSEFDPQAFEDLKAKVEGLRFAQGIRSAK